MAFAGPSRGRRGSGRGNTAASSAAAVSWDQDQTSLIAELLEIIELDPTSIEARKLLAEQYQAIGWNDAAIDLAKEILLISPNDREAKYLVSVYDTASARTSRSLSPSPYRSRAKGVSSERQVQDVQELRGEYQSLKDDAKSLLEEVLIFQQLAPDMDCSEQIENLTALAGGRMYSVARGTIDKIIPTARPSKGKGKEKASPFSWMGRKKKTTGAPQSAKALATSMKTSRRNALETAITDFQDFVRYQRGSTRSSDSDAIRTALRKRADALKAALPKEMAYIASDAFMHVEHETMKKTYVNSETMLGDPISDIPRDEFWVSEDGYAWDMSELAQAIKANKGAMRNPLSKQNFSVADVEAIVRHPSGKGLAALEVEQKQLIQGVRQETITRLRSMAAILLTDMSENSHPSHTAVDDFQNYIATLPEKERTAIDRLRVPAYDSHTGQPFDDTIGDAVRDAVANRLCFHKAGDLLKQAAEFLGRSRAG